MLPDKVFGLFYMYGLMIAIGLLFAFIVLFYYGKKKKVEEKFTDFIFYNGIASIALGFGSAGLFQATYNYIENPEAGFNFGQGFTFIGGLIGGVITFLVLYFIFKKNYKTRLSDVISALPCSIIIGHAFGRIGCFFAGCCYGKPTDSFLGVQFPHLSEPVHATMLYESAFLFVLFGITFYLVMKKDFKHNLSVYLIAYGIFRFLIEYLRGDDRGSFILGLSPSQFWSIVMVIAGVGVYFLLEYIRKYKPTPLSMEKAAKGEMVEEEEEETQAPPITSFIKLDEEELNTQANEKEETEVEE